MSQKVERENLGKPSRAAERSSGNVDVRCDMKIKFKSAWHRKTFTEFITENVKNPYLSRNEYIAAVFLLSADKFLWKRARRALTGYLVNFSSLNLSEISTEGYALFMAAKAIYRGGVDISLNELYDVDLIDDSTVMTIFAGVMLCRDGIGLLNWRT